jgi:hypothetical protein
MSIAVRTRGRRRSQTIASVAGLHVTPISIPKSRDRITPIVSAGEIRTEPRPTPRIRVMSRMTAATMPTTSGRARTHAARPPASRPWESTPAAMV